MLSSWLDWAIVAFPTVIGFMQSVWPITARKRSHRMIVLFLCVSFSGLLFWQQQNARKEHMLEIGLLPTKEQLTKLQNKIDQSEHDKMRLILNLASKTPLLDALSDMSNRPAIDVEEASELDLESGRFVWENKRLEKQAAAEQSRLKDIQASESALKDASPAFEYALKILASDLAALATKNGDRLLSYYVGVPTNIKSDQTVKDSAIFQMADNSDWKYAVSFSNTGASSSKNISMTIRSGPTSRFSRESTSVIFDYKSGARRFAVRVSLFGSESFNEEYPLADYKLMMTQWMKVLLVAEHNCYPMMKVTRPAP